ncbi:MAG TPA: hypothetical protein VGJ84_17490 [Polyangiaceae bacterium]
MQIHVAQRGLARTGILKTDVLEADPVTPVTHVTHGGRDRSPIQRASQDIPPATRRQVMRRDHGRCAVPGCKNSVFLDVHHVDLRSEGGGHDPDKLIVLCGAHHRASHRGTLLIEGRASTGLRFRHADGTVYGGAPRPSVTEAHAKMFRALRGLGFRETETRRALEQVRGTSPEAADTEQVFRPALAILTRTPSTQHAM